MNQPFVSNVCRVRITPALAEIAIGPGAHSIPTDVLPPRQIRVTNMGAEFEATMKFHRDGFIPTLRATTARILVGDGDAEYCEQKLLCYSMEAYLDDNDVKANPDELREAKAAAAAGVEVVIVAVIGDNRSPLSVCRNIVSGCQNPESLKADAQGAIEATSVFLIED